MVTVEIQIVTSTTDPYVRYHGKTIDQPLNSDFWTIQKEAIISTVRGGITHTQKLELENGSHYVIYSNSAAEGYPHNARIIINGELVAEGDITRRNQLKADFSVGIPPTLPPLPIIAFMFLPFAVGVGLVIGSRI